MPRNTLRSEETKLTPIARYVICPICGYRVQIARRGRNARAALSVLTGLFNEHLKKHEVSNKLSEVLLGVFKETDQ